MGTRAARLTLAALTALLAAPTATGQQPRNDAGIMTLKRLFNGTRPTFVPGVDCAGEEKDCALTSAIWHKGRFWVLGRLGWCCGLSADVSAKTFIHEFDVNSTYVKTVEIPLPVDTKDESDRGSKPSGTAPEVRDMATDQWPIKPPGHIDGEAVFIGSEEGIYVVTLSDPTDGVWELAQAGGFETIKTANGDKTISNGDWTNPIAGPGLDALKVYGNNAPNAEGEGYMAVAFDPRGNGGDGSFWVGADDGLAIGKDGLLPLGDPRGWDDPTDPSTQRTVYGGLYGDTRDWDGTSGGNTKPILEIDLHGNILTTLQNGTLITDPSSPLSGLASGGEWVAGGLEIDPLNGNLWVQVNMDHQLFELDTTTGNATGFARDLWRADPQRVGGITGLPNGDLGSYPSFWDVISLSATPSDDFFAVHRMHLYPGIHGRFEPTLEASVNAFPPGMTPPIPYTNLDRINLKLNSQGNPSSPALLMIDFNGDVNSDAGTFLALGMLPELRVHSAFSTPVDNGLALQVPWRTDSTLGLDLPTISFPVNTGDQIRMQAVYFHPLSQYSPGLMATNEIWFAGVGINEVMVEATGPSSDNADTSSGFFRVHWLSGPDILSVIFDPRSSKTNAAGLANARFDTDAPNMADFFGAGNSKVPGCQGTYRNNSDATTGLVYNATNTVVGLDAPVCDLHLSRGAKWQSGFVGTGGSGDDYAAIQFGFTDFGLDGAGNPAPTAEIFEFDCDTDGVGNDGGAHVGMVVYVVRSDGTVLKGELLPDVADPMRSFIAW